MVCEVDDSKIVTGFQRALQYRIKELLIVNDGFSVHEGEKNLKLFCLGFCEVSTMKFRSRFRVFRRFACCNLLIEGLFDLIGP